MELIIYLIPIIAVGILVWKFRKETAWWEYGLIIVPSLLLFLCLKYGLIYCNSLDTEYLGDIVSSITYYEDWDEMVMVEHTETTTDSEGHTHTRTYYVPERKYHPERYEYETITGKDCSTDEETFNKIVEKLNVNPVFKDMHRNYHSKDGDAYIYTWDKNKNTAYAITYTHHYTNKVKASSYSIFKYSKLSDQEIKDNNLYEYPKIIYDDQNTILGKNVSETETNALRYLNGYRGPKNQIRVFILCFYNTSMQTAEMQRAYWQGGNKNEFVVCLGIKNNKVSWCYPFSWCDKPMLEVKTRDYFVLYPYTDLTGYINWLDKNIDKNWNRKSFSDFSYINIELTNTQYVIILILMLLYNIGISYWVITNEFTLDNPDGTNNRYRYKWRY